MCKEGGGVRGEGGCEEEVCVRRGGGCEEGGV